MPNEYVGVRSAFVTNTYNVYDCFVCEIMKLQVCVVIFCVLYAKWVCRCLHFGAQLTWDVLQARISYQKWNEIAIIPCYIDTTTIPK